MAKSKLSKYNIVYIPIITFSHVTLNDVKIAMSLYCLIGRRRRHDVIDFVSLLAEKKCLKCFHVSSFALR